MRAFSCRNCGQLVFFENTACLNCDADLGFSWSQRDLLTLRSSPAGFEPLPLGDSNGEAATLHRCANSGLAGCNWLVDNDGELCVSCALTRTRPSDHDETGINELQTAEAAKRRLLFELGELGLPIPMRASADTDALAFDLLSSEHEPVTTGHADGLITLDLAEVDDARRVARRQQLAEPYRTVLGHLRHEVGHYYWPLLVDDDAKRAASRELFGDESTDYQAAIDRHYEQGPPPDWPEHNVSAYATMHPSEDWAETFAHYLHIRDTLQTAGAYGVTVEGPDPGTPQVPHDAFNPQPTMGEHDFTSLLSAWLPLTYAMNALNRSMGRTDLYPFVLPEAVIEKLGFIHGLVEERPAA